MVCDEAVHVQVQQALHVFGFVHGPDVDLQVVGLGVVDKALVYHV